VSANADNAHAKRGTGVIGSEVGMCTRGDDDNRVPFSSPLTWTSHNSHRTFLAPPRRAKRRAMKIQTVLDVFHERVPAAFGFLTNPYGFKLVRDDDYAFVAKAAHCDVVVELDWGSIVVSLRPMVTGRAVRLSFIVGAQDPSILFLPRYPWGPEDALEEITRGPSATGARAMAPRIRAARQGSQAQARQAAGGRGLAAPELLRSSPALRVDPR
jgi:hypothetical protein